MSLDANRDLVRRFYAEVINGQDLDAIERVVAEGDLVAAPRPRSCGSRMG